MAAGIDATYEPVDTPTVELAEAVAALRRDEYLGAAIGVPHKERVVPMLDRLTDEAQKTGAVDTVTRDGVQLVGHNTEVLGFKASAGGAGRQPEDAQDGRRARRGRCALDRSSTRSSHPAS